MTAIGREVIASLHLTSVEAVPAGRLFDSHAADKDLSRALVLIS